MPTFRDTTQRGRVVRVLLSLMGRSELPGSAAPVEAAQGLAAAGALTGSERWLLALALWLDDGSAGEEPGLAGWDLLDPPRQHAVATLLEALAEDALAYDQDPAQGGAAVDLWLRKHGA